jgi:hypothetical protein
VFQITQSTLLREQQFYFNLTAATTVDFFVYEGLSSTGTFNRIYTSGPQILGPGQQFYLDDNMNVQLVAGRYYYIGAAWQGSAIYWISNPPLPIPTTFGNLLYGPGSSGGTYPPAASVNLTQTGTIYPQILKTGFGIVTTMNTAQSGTLPDSSNTPQQFQSVIDPAAPAGVYTYAITTSGNDPGTPSHVLNIRIAVVSSVTDVEPGDAIARSFALYQNEPNPFNPMTKVMFDMPEERRVSLAIYDASGRRIKTLVDGVLRSGRHEIAWNGLNDSGEGVASGVYFLRMEAGAYTDRIKMTLVK